MRLSEQTEDPRTIEARRFRAALGGLSVRSAQALQLKLVAGMSVADCAAFFGIPQAAFDVMLLRAAREARARLEPGVQSIAPTSYAEEVEQAAQLAGSVDSGASLAGELGALLRLLQQIQSAANEIRAQNAAELLEEKTSLRSRRKNLFWRALLLIIIAASLALYLWPRPPLRIISRVPPEDLR